MIARSSPRQAPSRSPQPRWSRAVAGLRVAASVGLLALTLGLLDLHELGATLRGADVAWLLVGLLLSVPMMGLMAWRWSFTAQRMGVALPLGVAWREYYVSVLLNSVLPGGVAGDVVRVARHAEGPQRPLGPVARAVVVERAVGQLVLWLVVLVGAAAWGLGDLFAAVGVALVMVGLGSVALGWLGRGPRAASTGPGRLLGRVRQELHAALLERGALGVQLLASLGSLLALIGMFHACAAAIGSSLTPAQALLVVPLVLAATIVPLTVGGWGVRELSAMALFELVALPAAEGAATAVLFGAVSLVSVLPGLVLLVMRRRPS